jgi:outer membrane receptor protein involved in Fe transport
MKNITWSLVTLFIGCFTYAQTVVTGTVTEASSNQPIPGANILVVGQNVGASSDFDGNFRLEVSAPPPFQITISILGFQTVTVNITQNNQRVTVALEENQTLLDEVIISASRTPESIRESPVSIERMSLKDIENTASPTFYDGIENLKGVQLNTSSFTFKSVNTRGFATFANERFVQLVDGVDNSSPALNFVFGNIIGLSELDVAGIELLPGASSALYGANAFNGILFMTSKNPFDYQGVTTYAKTGFTSQDAAGDNTFYDVGFRMATATDDGKFGVKFSASFIRGEEWHATDTRHRDINGVVGTENKTRADTDFDGVNVFGDLVGTTLNFDQLAGLPAGTLGAARVTRTGYNETDLTDNDARSFKLGYGLHYRPWANDFEIELSGRFGSGNTIYQGTNRFRLKDFFIHQHKLEFRNKNFFVRGYITDEDAGNSYDMVFAGININRAWKSDTDWFTQYAQTFIGARLGLIPGLPAQTEEAAHSFARQQAETGRLIPGTPEFVRAFNQVVANPDLQTGAKFQDQTKLYHVEGNYNLTHLVKFADVQVGGSFREFLLNSSGTIFNDADGPIDIRELAVYTQVSKKFLDDRLKLTGSIRWDESRNFDSNYSPRISAVYTAGANKQHTFRASFQTGFRNPTTQDQYIGLDLGNIILVGSAPDNLDSFRRTFNLNGGGTATITGRKAYEDSYTISSAQAFGAAVQAAINGGLTPQQAIGANAGLLEAVETDVVQPEEILAYEVGYRGAFKGFTVDASFFFNNYNDFIANKNVLTPLVGSTKDLTTFSGAADVAQGNTQAFQVFTNSQADITSKGFTIGVTKSVFGNYELQANYDFNEFDFDRESDPDFRPGFNTPKHRVKASLSNSALFKNFGFNVSWRWFDSYFWQASFGDGYVPAANVVDAQVSYNLPVLRSSIKIGVSNLLNDEYQTAIGPGLIGAQYFASWKFDLQ